LGPRNARMRETCMKMVSRKELGGDRDLLQAVGKLP